ncbi:MAG: AIM24 family protein [Thermoguttaceae bacterium]|nr:AIM24 family protein [Thermoguttaceae bacterium]
MDYKICGGNLPVVVCYLKAGRSIFSEAGGRTWMKGAVRTEQSSRGGLLSGLGRLAAGESFFLTTYTAESDAEIAFASSFPGAIVPRVLAAGESIICQKSAFLAATPGGKTSCFFQKKLGAGFFGGEGFVMQRLAGPGVVFLEVDGYAYEYQLQPGEKVVCDTGVVAYFDETCSIDIVRTKGLKNMFFGGEGLFDTVVTGPGKVTLQTAPIPVVAMLLSRFLPSNK